LNAVQLPELIMQSLDAYERQALELGQDRALLDACKRKLADRRKDAPLFDTPAFARHLESAYATMAERARQGLAPKSFRIGADGSSHDG
jgi:predicted O-linked N-acetylglucosamine transferase (SPINDLY family)